MKYLGLLFASIFLFSCEKIIELDLEEAGGNIVIEGNITNNAGPYIVKVSRTIKISESGALPAVTNAFATITDNLGVKDTLTNIGNGLYRTNKIVGAAGKTYKLIVDVDGKKYESSTTMPAMVSLNDLEVRKIGVGGFSQSIIFPKFKDPIEKGNKYLFTLTVNGVLDKSILVYDDNVNNGLENERPLQSNSLQLKSGDLVEVEMQCVDVQTHLYYQTLAQIAGNGPGGGSTPSNPPNGLTNNAMGLFSAHTSQVKSITIP